MKFYGIQKLSLIDYPEKACATLFTGGCNYRCPFCHNSPLVLDINNGADTVDEEEILAFLKTRTKLLDGVTITGGEPTLYGDSLVDFIAKVHNLGFDVKLDTNGTRPDVLEKILSAGDISYVAMDIKTSPENYSVVTGVSDALLDNVRRSASLLMNGYTDFEFRTTVVSPLHTDSDFVSIAKWLKGDEKYFLQSFTDSGDILENRSGDGTLGAYPPETLTHFADILRDGGITNLRLREIG